VHSYNHYAVSYSPTPHPLMACWDEHNARLRADAYNEDKFDGGVVCLDTFLFTIYIYLI
jgi:hypothetical protein